MANVLDLRRRIRSVKNTRQITKAMKMVSAAKLRRAQERALAARPYATMITSVLESLIRRVDIFDQKTGNLRHPALPHPAREARPAGRHQRRQGICRRVQRQHPQDRLPVHQRQHRQGDRRRSRGPQGPRPDAPPLSRRRLHRADRRARPHAQGARRARAPSKSPATIPACSIKLDAGRVFELAHSIIARYVHEEIDAAYIVYNEFKSVIAQRLVVEQLLPLIKIGEPQIAGAVEPTHGRARARRRSRPHRRHRDRGGRHPRGRRRSQEVRHRERGLHLRAAGRGTLRRPAAAVRLLHALSRHDGVGRRRARGPHDGDGFGNQQRLGHDRLASRCT